MANVFGHKFFYPQKLVKIALFSTKDLAFAATYTVSHLAVFIFMLEKTTI
jgi:hypothetical protein